MVVTPPNVEHPYRDATLKLLDMIAAAGLSLSEAESRELEQLLIKYWDIFEIKSSKCSRLNSVYHQIDNGRSPNDSPFSKETSPSKTSGSRQETWQHGATRGYLRVRLPLVVTRSSLQEEECWPALLLEMRATECCDKDTA
jgi:hypothetical protein